MKIERINENQIRCTLSSFDLSVRDLNLGELAYGSEKAKKLFREMIQKASCEVGFDAEDIPLMVEAIPLSGESIMLIITKIADPEELDTRFSKFSPTTEDDNPLASLASELLDGADGLLELFSRNTSGSNSGSGVSLLPFSQTDTANPLPEKEEKTADSPVIRFFTFDSLEAVCRAARVAGAGCQVSNRLYKNPVNSRYYLVLDAPATETNAFHRICNLLSEYGTSVRTTESAEAYYREHYEILVKEHALETLASL